MKFNNFFAWNFPEVHLQNSKNNSIKLAISGSLHLLCEVHMLNVNSIYAP